MSEFLRKFAQDKRVRVGATVAGLGLTAAACGNAGTLESASTAQMQPCGVEHAYSQQGGKTPVKSIKGLERQARSDIATLYKRARLNGSSINVPHFYDDQTEIVTSSNSLTLNFDDLAQQGWPYSSDTDSVVFNVNGSSINVTPGAIACTTGNNIYPNQAFNHLQEYVQATAGLNSLNN